MTNHAKSTEPDTAPAAAAAVHIGPDLARRPAKRRIVGVSTKMYFSAARTESFTRTVIHHLSGGSVGGPPPPPANLEESSKPPTLTLTPEQLSRLNDIDMFIIPDFITLRGVVDAVSSSAAASDGSSPAGKILVGAQDCYSEDAGAFTGEVSPAVLKEVGCSMVELGHAERKRLFGETDEKVAEKVAAVVRNGMIPLICVGELHKGEDGDMKIAVEEVLGQVEVVLSKVSEEAEVVLAYEPVWAIGASEPAGVEYVKAVVRGLRESDELKRRGERVRIVYGGAAGPGLFGKLGGEVDGLFLGRFGHDPGAFVEIMREVAEFRG